MIDVVRRFGLFCTRQMPGADWSPWKEPRGSCCQLMRRPWQKAALLTLILTGHGTIEFLAWWSHRTWHADTHQGGQCGRDAGRWRQSWCTNSWCWTLWSAASTLEIGRDCVKLSSASAKCKSHRQISSSWRWQISFKSNWLQDLRGLQHGTMHWHISGSLVSAQLGHRASMWSMPWIPSQLSLSTSGDANAWILEEECKGQGQGWKRTKKGRGRRPQYWPHELEANDCMQPGDSTVDAPATLNSMSPGDSPMEPASTSTLKRQGSFRIAYLFSGPEGPHDGFATQVKSLGGTCVCFDQEISDSHDMLDQHGWERNDSETSEFDGYLLSPPCCTFSPARHAHDGGPPPLRSAFGSEIYESMASKISDLWIRRRLEKETFWHCGPVARHQMPMMQVNLWC